MTEWKEEKRKIFELTYTTKRQLIGNLKKKKNLIGSPLYKLNLFLEAKDRLEESGELFEMTGLIQVVLDDLLLKRLDNYLTEEEKNEILRVVKMAKIKTTKSIKEIAGCIGCKYFNGATGNCWLYGYTTDEINRDPLFIGLKGSFKISETKGCLSWETRKVKKPKEEKTKVVLAAWETAKLAARSSWEVGSPDGWTKEEKRDLSRRLTRDGISHWERDTYLVVSMAAYHRGILHPRG